MDKDKFKAQFDIILDASDDSFIDDLTRAMDIKPDDKINIITPQFERTDGRVILYLPNTPAEYEALKKMSEENLRKMGCQLWDNENGVKHWLYPHEWYGYIPNGTEIINISGKKELFEQGKTDDDIRFGALSYGFLQI
ncbi:MAG TPA: hypothetical protein ENH85_00355 [Candidatus Scalindua sp.]|nr:hypothetical protein [Candidatus Scalindua sp.]